MRDLFAMCFGASLVMTAVFVIIGHAGNSALYAAITFGTFICWLAFYMHGGKSK